MSCANTSTNWSSVLIVITKCLRLGRSTVEAYEIWNKEKFRACLEIISVLSGVSELAVQGHEWYVNRQSGVADITGSDSNSTALKVNHDRLRTALSTISVSSNLISICMKEAKANSFDFHTVGSVFLKMVPLLIQMNAELAEKKIYSESTAKCLTLLGGSAALAVVVIDKKVRKQQYKSVSVFFDQLGDIYKRIGSYFKRLADGRGTPTASDQQLGNATDELYRTIDRHQANISRQNSSQSSQQNATSIQELRARVTEIDRLILLTSSDTELLPAGSENNNDISHFRCPITNRIPRFPCMPKVPDNYLAIPPYYQRQALMAILESNRINGTQNLPPQWPVDVVAFTEANIISDITAKGTIKRVLERQKTICILRIDALTNFERARLEGLNALNERSRALGSANGSSASNGSFTARAVSSAPSASTLAATASMSAPATASASASAVTAASFSSNSSGVASVHA